MAITNTDFVVKLNYTYEQPCLAVHYYRKSTPFNAGDAAQLANLFDVFVQTPYSTLCNNFVTFQNIEVYNLVELTDYASIPSSDPTGDIVTSSPGPRFVAYGFRLNRATRQGRHGYKRVAGIAEDLIDAHGLVVDPALQVGIDAFINAQLMPLSSLGEAFFQMIPHRARTLMPDGTYKYVLTDLFGISSCTFYGLTTQNTRKR